LSHQMVSVMCLYAKAESHTEYSLIFTTQYFPRIDRAVQMFSKY
jgi:hypothetical protein